MGIDEKDLSDCPYYQGTGSCSYRCWPDGPACWQEEPAGGWPSQRNRLRAAPDPLKPKEEK